MCKSESESSSMKIPDGFGEIFGWNCCLLCGELELEDCEDPLLELGTLESGLGVCDAVLEV